MALGAGLVAQFGAPLRQAAPGTITSRIASERCFTPRRSTAVRLDLLLPIFPVNGHKYEIAT
jgi:hypothetical protein